MDGRKFSAKLVTLSSESLLLKGPDRVLVYGLRIHGALNGLYVSSTSCFHVPGYAMLTEARTGGAHSPISSWYGMGADQVLEMEVVTADGEYRIINEKAYPELFWAMRGGGGSTYAIMLSATVKAYPRLPTVTYSFAFNTSANSQTYWEMVGYFHSQIPSMSEKGAMGYYYIVPYDPTTANISYAGKLLGAFFFPHKTMAQASAIMGPVVNHIKTQSDGGDDVKVVTIVTPPVDFTTMWLNNPPESVGVDGRLGSYLLTNHSLHGNITALAETLKIITPPGEFTLGHMVAGPGVRNAKIPGGEDAVLPAWRRAYTHVVTPRSWPYLNATAKEAATTELRDVLVPALKALEPNSGAYVNEADPTSKFSQHPKG